MSKNRYNHRIQEALRLTDPLSLERTIENIRRDALKTAAPFNYRPAESITKAALAGEISEAQARLKCSRGSELSVRQNTDAALLLLAGVKEMRTEPVFCHDLKKVYLYQIRDDLAFRTRVPFFFTKNGTVNLTWFQFCLTHHYSKYQWSILAVVLQDLFGEEFQPNPCDVAFIDLCAPPGAETRQFRLDYASKMSLPSKKEVKDFFQMYADAYDICGQRGIEKVKPQRKPKQPDAEESDQHDLF